MIRPRRRAIFRLAAILLGLSPFLLLEILCRITGWGQQDLLTDPFIGFAAVQPLFQQTADGSEFHTAPNRLQYFREDRFSATKPADEFRIFVFGGSTVQGHPFSLETSFPTFLQLSLQTAHPDRSWKVVNCGGVSYASYRLLPIVAECLNYEPDLFVFCSGQNEFLEDVTYGTRRDAAPLLAPLWTAASRLQSFKAAVELINRRQTQPLLPAEVQTRLDQPAGLGLFHRDDAHARQVANHYGNNITRLIQLCRQRNLPLLIIQPPVNLSDCPPFKSEFSVTTTPEQQAAIRKQLSTAARLAANAPAAAVEMAESAVEADPRFALAWYELGQLQLTASNHAAAAEAFERALDEDVCPLRMTSPLRQTLRETVTRERTAFLDAHALLSNRCRGGIVGEQVLVDHVHPSFRGHEDIAIAIATWMQTANLLQPATPDWEINARTACHNALQSLDDTYFLQGRRRLQVLKNWAAGRATQPDMAPPPP
ncbi:MAG: hypothetical protein RLZZ458_1937 [Planctomycetota bacterium]